jgi:hypothetical protein
MDYIKGEHYTVPASAVDALAEDPDVAYITPNRAISPTFDSITNGTIGASYETSKGYNGAGVGVAVIDSGIVDLPDFHTGATSRIVYQQSFVLGTPNRPVWARNARGRHNCGQWQWQRRLSGTGDKRKSDQSARAGRKRQRHRCGRDTGDRYRHRAEIPVTTSK